MRRTHTNLLLTALFLALAPTAPATTWYVNGVNGSDINNCLSSTTACKTIGHAISLAASGDTIMVAAATYTENLTIGISLNVIGAGAATTIIDGGRVSGVVTINSASAHVTLSGLTIRNGHAFSGGGISNIGILTLVKSNVSGNTVSCSGFSCRVAGGGIYNSGGTITIQSSTISGNSATCSESGFRNGSCGAAGGGIYNLATLIISKSTLVSNSAHSSCSPISAPRPPMEVPSITRAQRL
jgi:hypothetical protein